MSEHELKWAMVLFALLSFALPLLIKHLDCFEINHVGAAGAIALTPASLWAVTLGPLPQAPLAFAVYIGFFLASTYLILRSAAPQVALSVAELRLVGFAARVINQAVRILNEEALFRGLLFMVPLYWLPNLPWWAVALPQALLFATVHYLPVRSCLRGSSGTLSIFISAFVFPLLGALVFAYMAVATGSLLLPVLLHWGTNVLVEFVHQRRRTSVVFEYGPRGLLTAPT